MNSQAININNKKYELPNKPGVYFFKKGRVILYIGKATNLHSRARSYFSPDLIEKRGPIITEMIEQANKIEWQKTDSVLEALLLEASLIKKYQPKYNTKEKDDKSHNYIVITDEDFPRVLIKRGRELQSRFTKDNLLCKGSYLEKDVKYVFGPFPQGGILREALKIVRKIFPFRDKCIPFTSFGPSGSKSRFKPCFNRQINLCPGVCTGEISKLEYRKIITNIKMFLCGKKVGLLKKLEREMRVFAKKKEFEKAEKLKRQIFALNHIQDVALLKEKIHLGAGLPNEFRIEGYDVAHLSGKAMLGVMTVIENGEANKKEYRKFNIKSVDGIDDIASLREILERRFAHKEWKYPKIIVVDGGKAQKNIAEKVIKKLGIKIPVIAVVKDERHKAKEILGLNQFIKLIDRTSEDVLGKKDFVNKFKKEILFANFEAHRFSISGHRKKMRKSFI